MNGNTLRESVVLAVCAVVLATGWYGLELGPEPSPPTNDNLVEVTTWNWKKDRSGKILAVFGSIRNNTSEAFKSVVLELRTEDASETVIGRHTIFAGALGSKATKPFREDITRSGTEAMGYISVKSLGR
jgi:hypothetical protein